MMVLFEAAFMVAFLIGFWWLAIHLMLSFMMWLDRQANPRPPAPKPRQR